jgi:hypothetical protein
VTAVPETAATSWRAVSASRRGSSHTADVPNQDAVRCEQLARADDTDLWVAAVADGHGGARYVRSDVGARTAVDMAVGCVRRALESAPDTDLSSLLREQVPHIVDAWRDAVRAHAAAHPFTEAERARAGSDPDAGNGLTPYGATLLVALVGDHGVSVAQVGDGDALVRSHGFATRPVPGDDRLVAGETTSLCLATAVDDFRHAFLPASTEPDLVLLATDGYGNSFAQVDWWQGLLGDVASFVERLGISQLEEQLPDWLEESARVGGDDVSAVLLVRRPLAVVPPSTAAPVPVDPETAPKHRTLELPRAGGPHARTAGTEPDGAAPHGRRSWRVPIIAVLATVLVVLGIIAVLLLMGPGDPGTPTDNRPEPSSTTTPPGSDTGTGSGEKAGAKKGDGNGDGKKGSGTKDSPPTEPAQRPPEGTVVEPPGDPGEEETPKPIG